MFVLGELVHLVPRPYCKLLQCTPFSLYSYHPSSFAVPCHCPPCGRVTKTVTFHTMEEAIAFFDSIPPWEEVEVFIEGLPQRMPL